MMQQMSPNKESCAVEQHRQQGAWLTASLQYHQVTDTVLWVQLDLGPIVWEAHRLLCQGIPLLGPLTVTIRTEPKTIPKVPL